MSEREKNLLARTNTLVICFVTYFIILTPLLFWFMFSGNEIVMYISAILIILMLLANILFMVDTKRYNSWWHIILSWIVVLPAYPFVICISKLLNWVIMKMNKTV